VVRGIAREPGRRSKVAVEAPAGDLDPQGACIGPRGIRHRAVTSELGEEQVQIVSWSSDPERYVANALTPATALRVELDPDTPSASPAALSPRQRHPFRRHLRELRQLSEPAAMTTRGHQPARMCAGCRGVRPRLELVRLVCVPGAGVKLDSDLRLPGRGAYLCS